MKRPRLIRGGALGIGFIMLAGVLLPTATQETSASWMDVHKGRGQFQAAIANGATLENCHNVDSGFLENKPAVRITWRLEQRLHGASVSYRITTVSLDGEAVEVISNGQTEEEIEISEVTLKDIVGGVLGSADQFTVQIQTFHSIGGAAPSVWKSPDTLIVGVAPVYIRVLGISLPVLIGYKCA